MNDKIIRRFILMRVRQGVLGILTRRSDRIQRSLGGLSEDVLGVRRGLGLASRHAVSLRPTPRGGIVRVA